ncbi:MAG: hypothetical protein FJX74_00895 [Armatimonadetes bacterium]|nr:hypothetical protein [Armatimonadota bacterium]
MRFVCLIVVAVSMVLASGAYAQVGAADAVSLGMGGVVLATPNGPVASTVAPLGFWNSTGEGFSFARETLMVPDDVREAVASGSTDGLPRQIVRVTGGYGRDGLGDGFGLVGGSLLDLPSSTQFSLGMATTGGGPSVYAVSLAKPLCDSDFRAGISLLHNDDRDVTTITPSVAWDTTVGGGRGLRLALQWRDAMNQHDNGLDFGVAWQATSRLLVAADVLDLAGEDDVLVNGGVEYGFGPFGNAAHRWALRVGAMDSGDGHDITAGAGCRISDDWQVDVGWANTEPDSSWLATVGTSF